MRLAGCGYFAESCGNTEESQSPRSLSAEIRKPSAMANPCNIRVSAESAESAALESAYNKA